MKKDINWRGGSVLIGYHLLLLISLPIYLSQQWPDLGLVILGFTLYVFAALGITAGYHRLYSHKSYKSGGVFENVLLFAGTLATQGSVLEWAHDHRQHHRHVDTEKDPYETPKGFWHSHLLWMFKKRPKFHENLVQDLLKNRKLVFQHEYYGWLVLALNLVIFLIAGWWFQDFWGAFIIAVLARMFLVHHCTWFINSLAHMWGAKPYSTEHSAVNNWILGILTMGEGYHNFHHTFAGDYRNGIRWYQYDITKGIIWLASKMGLVSDLRTVKSSTIQKKLILMDRQLMLERISQPESSMLAKLETEIVSISDSLIADLKSRARTKRKLDRLRPEGADREIVQNLRQELHSLKESIEKSSQRWAQLCREILDSPRMRGQAG